MAGGCEGAQGQAGEHNLFVSTVRDSLAVVVAAAAAAVVVVVVVVVVVAIVVEAVGKCDPCEENARDRINVSYHLLLRCRRRWRWWMLCGRGVLRRGRRRQLDL